MMKNIKLIGLAIASLLLCLCSASHTQSCIDSEGDVRIYTTPSFNSGAGRVEICHNNLWGTVAESDDTPWSEKNAQVACRLAGYDGSLNSMFLNGISFEDRANPSVPVHYQGVQCLGSETNLLNCDINNDTAAFRLTNGNYFHVHDVFVVCRPLSSPYSDIHLSGVQVGDIRLLGDSRNGRGAVEIYSSQFQWTSICPDGFSDSDAAVLCTTLGYASGRRQVYSITDSIGPRILYNSECSVNRPALTTDRLIAGVCSFQFNINGCPSGSTQYAGVECTSSSVSEGSIRLFGVSERKGLLETFYNGKWGMICSGGTFGAVEATAVCTELGFGSSQATYMAASSRLLEGESNLKPIWRTDVDCPSGSTRLTECNQGSQLVGYGNCNNQDIVAVTCAPFRPLLYPGQIAGIAVGVPVALIIVLLCCAWCCGVDKHWAKRHDTKCYRSMTTCCSSMTAGCSACCCQGTSNEVPHQRTEAARERHIAIATTDQRDNQQQCGRLPRETVALQPEPQDHELTMTVSPPYSTAGIGFEQVAEDLPPPYSQHLPYPTYAPHSLASRRV